MCESSKFNIREICRGCLSDKRDNLRSIFDSTILDTFTLCTNIQVSEQDGLPTLICNSCVYKAVSWFSFKSQCEQSDQILKSTFKYTINEPTIKTPTINEQTISQSQLENTDAENVLIIFQESESLDINRTEEISVEPLSEIENNSDNCNQLHLKAEEYSVNQVESSKNQLAEDNSYKVEFIRDVDDQIFGDIYESDEDESKQLSDSGQLESDSKPSNKKLSAITQSKQQFTCNECGKMFRNSDRLLSHQRGEHEGKKPEVCPICEKEFNNLRALRRHRLKHSDTKQFRCNECGKMYKYQTSLTLHKKGHTNVRRFVCDLCGKSFVRAHGLQSHLLSHSTLTPYSCNYDSCDKQFKNIIMLRNHQRRHEGIKKFICSECGKEFMTSAELNTHTRSHTGSKPFGCSMCSKSYKTKSHLSVHLRSHSGSRPYACDFCPLKFAHNKVLKQHRLVHLGERPWNCDICNRPFRQKSTLSKHKKTHKLKSCESKWNDQTENPIQSQSINLSNELVNLEK